MKSNHHLPKVSQDKHCSDGCGRGVCEVEGVKIIPTKGRIEFFMLLQTLQVCILVYGHLQGLERLLNICKCN